MELRFLVLIALMACRSATGESRGLIADDNACLCPCACAPADASPDASSDSSEAPPVDLVEPWTRTVLTPGAASGVYRGADGVAMDAAGCWITAWEEGGAITRACPGSPWTTELVASGLLGVEDARAGDLDDDGTLDVVSCSDSGGRCYITFRGSSSVTVTLAGSQGHGRAMQAAIADMDGDGLPDVLFGTRAGTAANPAVIAWLANPGSALARTGSAWTYHLVDRAGWTMSLIALDVDHDGDLDIVTSDRSYTLGPSGEHLWDRNGVRWLEQTPIGWTSHAISPPSGACPIGQPMCATRTPGDEMFARVDGNTVWDCQSSDAAAYSRIVRHSTTDWISWTHEVLPAAPNVGHCQGVAITDIDGDGLADVIVSSWKGNAYPVPASVAGESGVYWLRAPTWERGEISGPSGGKFDNVEVIGRCVITSEQLDPQGGLGVVAYCPPGADL